MSKSTPVKLTDDELDSFLEAGTVTVLGSRSRFAAFPLLAAAVIIGVAVASATFPALTGAAAITNQVSAFWSAMPEKIPLDQPLAQHTILLDKNGVEFARFISENRVDVKRDQINDTFVNALVSSEDRSFYTNDGIDVKGMIRAALSNTQGNSTQGASTITQQYVKNILISNARTPTEQAVAQGKTLADKAQEAKYALWVDRTLTKDQILTGYANAIFLGNGAYGVEAAAHTYFSIPASQLNVPQSAMLVALLKAPSSYDPLTHPERATKIRNLVIDSMVANRKLSKKDGAAAKATPLGLKLGTQPAGCGVSAYPYFCALVQQELLTDPAFGATPEDRQAAFHRGGMTITTTLDRAVADKANAAALNALGGDNSVASGIAVVEPGTGHIAAVAQNRTWAQTQIVYATSRMQPGSVMKPVVLASALSSGFNIKTRFNGNGPYRPTGFDYPSTGFNNSGGEQPGTIDATSAIRMSINVYFIKVAEKIGVEDIAKTGRLLGLTSLPTKWSGREISMAIGTFEVSPLEIANVYATFAAGGVHCDTTTIVSITSTDTGKPVPGPETACTQAISNTVAQQMNTVLQSTFQRGGTLSSVGQLPGRLAGAKTGTTDNSSASWTAGMTPQYATAVWVGDPRGGQAYPLRNVTAYGHRIGVVFGASIAGPIWKELMVGIHTGLPAVNFGATGSVGFPAEGKQKVPNTVGLKLDAAVRALDDAGFTVTVSHDTAGDKRFDRNTVTAQSLTAGGPLPADRTISLTLSPGSNTDVNIDSSK